MSVKEGIKQFKFGFGRQLSNSKKLGDQMLDDEQEQISKSQRENQQLVVYIFVAFVIAAAWILGFFEFSFLWVFGLIVLTFLIWWSKVLSLTEQCIKQREVLLHRKRALRQSETSEWLNFVINRWWVFSSSSISDLIKRSLDPLLMDVKPAFLESIELESFTVGDSTPYIKYVQVFEYSEGSGGAGSRKPMSWGNISSPPPGLKAVQQYQIVLEIDLGLTCDEFKMIFRTRFGGKWMGMNLDVALEKLNITGKMQMLLHLDMDMPFPHVASVSISFVEKPEVWFAVRMLKAVQMMEIPVLKSWLHTLVMDGLTQALVDPGKIDIKVESSGPTHEPAKARSKTKAQGVLIVTISGEQTKGSVFVEDVRYCSLRVGEQKRHTQHTQGSCTWQETCSFLVGDIKADKLQIKSKSKILLSTYTLATFDLALVDYPLQHKPSIDTIIEEKVAKRQGGGTVKYDLNLEYVSLPSIDDDPEHGAPSSVAGVMYVCVHSATQLLGLDRNGLSDPYCILYSNGKKIKTTHYVARTKNPSWEVSTEMIVGDYTKTMLSFTVYDWDGRSVSEDDFLGSAHLLLAREEPAVYQRSLTLGYNVLNVGQVDNNKLGSICVTVIFRPVPAVAKSELGNIAGNTISDQTPAIRRSIINSASVKRKSKKESVKSKDEEKEETKEEKQKLGSSKRASMVVSELLSMGQGILELNIIQAKDLVSMDSNGFSDPYCDVRINNERKFTSSIKKKTLNPVWDEWVTTQLPKPTEVLEVVVWDRDPFFRKDFLGSISFTLDELKFHSRNIKNEGWFQLQRIRSGFIQLRFNVISDDMEGQVTEEKQKDATFSSSSPPPPAPPLNNSNSNSRLATTPGTPPSATSTPPPGPHHQQQRPHHRRSQDPDDAEQEEPLLQQNGSSLAAATSIELPPKRRQRKRRAWRERLKEMFAFRRPQAPASVPTRRRYDTDINAGGTMPNHQQHDPADSSPEPSIHTKRRGSRFSFRHKRSHSDVNLKAAEAAAKSGKGKSGDKYGTLDRSSGLAGSSSTEWDPTTDSFTDLRTLNTESVSQATSIASLAAEEKYVGVQGRLGGVRGLEIAAGHLYCKVRLDNRTYEKRIQKFSQGKVIAKTDNVDAGPGSNFDLCYDIDYGRGVAREALIIFDLKTSHKEHLATKGYSLHQLLGEETEVNRWVLIENGIELEVNISQNNSSPLTPSKRRRASRLFSFNRSKQKLH